MTLQRSALVLLATATACSHGSGSPTPVDAAPPPVPDLASAADLSPAHDDRPLEIRFLGVGGFMMRRGQDAIVTAPLYSNPSILATTITGVASDPTEVMKFASSQPFDEVRALLVGHAHYDHLLDVPTVFPLLAPDALIYGNSTMFNLLASYFPDRSTRCTTPAPAYSIPRERVIALDAAGADKIDRRVCVGGGSTAGQWIQLPNLNVRIYALCSMHPPQVGPFTFAPGSVDTEQCDPPSAGDDWKEGQTLSYLIDFLDTDGITPAYRIYYQDAPTNAPVGQPPADVLMDKRVDAALLCVGSYSEVADQPAAILAALAPRYTIGGHWENFFQTQDLPLQPIPFLDLTTYTQNAAAAMAPGSVAPIVVDGTATSTRSFVPNPGTIFSVSRDQP
jgi:hypothetical protein